MECTTDDDADMSPTKPPIDDVLKIGRETLLLEADTVRGLVDQLDETFVACCQMLSGYTGRIIVTGMGKSGHVGQKIAATFASTGSPAFFVHPAEASHGDLGMITADDIVLVLSNSGETPELLGLMPRLRTLGVTIISLTGNRDSELAQSAELSLELRIDREACPLNLAPTASTTAMLAMGDALAMTLSRLRGFEAKDFANTHPGGDLGRRLLTTVSDLMRQGEQIPRVSQDTLLRDALPEISEKGLGMTTVLDAKGQLIGVFTDGDLRRCVDDAVDIHSVLISEVMTREFQVATPDELAADALRRMRDCRINAMPVLEDRQLIGAFNMHDLIKAGIR